jgi:hypothetical protein
MDLFAVPPTVIVQLKKVSPVEAAKLLAPYRHKLTDKEYENYLSMAQPAGLDPPQAIASQVRVSVTDPLRRRFMAAAWIAGASFRQIADLFAIRRPTAMDQISLVLPKHMRDTTSRLYPTPVRWEFLLLLRRAWESDRESVQGDLTKAAERLCAKAMEEMD